MLSTCYSCSILIKLEFSGQIFEKKYSNIKFYENPSSESRVVPFGQTDRHDEANGIFRNFAKAPKSQKLEGRECLLYRFVSNSAQYRVNFKRLSAWNSWNYLKDLCMLEDESLQHDFSLNYMSGYSLALSFMAHIFINIFNLHSSYEDQAFKRCSAYQDVFHIVT